MTAKLLEKHTGVYSGTFDPVNNAHLDIILKASKIVDRLIVAVAKNEAKKPMFPLEKRVEMTKAAIDALHIGGTCKVEVLPFSNLLVEFARQHSAQLIIKGLKNGVDFDQEFEMASINTRLDKDIITIFLSASDDKHFISSRFIREIATMGGDVSSMVPPNVAETLKKFPKN